MKERTFYKALDETMKEKLLSIAEEAGRRILQIYNRASYEITQKADQSELTEADLASHHFISAALAELYPEIPLISEEAKSTYAYDLRKEWSQFFLLDPLDGTKEFIQRNGEFTINIALIQNKKPVLGLIYVPVLDLAYYAAAQQGAYKIEKGQSFKLSPAFRGVDEPLRVLVSRSHCCPQTEAYIEKLREHKEVIRVAAGSALKFGWLAEGKGDLYPRFAPTKEWDTAAGQIIVNEIGKKVLLDTGEELQYNKKELVNPGFVVQ
jgi:3'(2'), 5'-bisphosphate nucleotidase